MLLERSRVQEKMEVRDTPKVDTRKYLIRSTLFKTYAGGENDGRVTLQRVKRGLVRRRGWFVARRRKDPAVVCMVDEVAD